MMKILIVDDEINIRKTISYCLAAEGHTVIAVSNPSDAVEEAKRRAFDMAFVDLKLGEENGLDLIPLLLTDTPWTKIVVITAHASIESVVDAMRSGAVDYIPKPFSPDQVKLLTARISRLRELETQIVALQEDIQRLGPEDRLQSANPTMQRMIELTKKAAPSEAIVLLRGESGTGKTVFAKAIHNWSVRKSNPFVVVSCPAVPSELLESELFGHAKGAFTGAVKDNPGRIASCEGGTLFLDEIGDMAPAVQAKLLRFIQDKEYERLGESASRKADIRIIAATNANLEKKMDKGLFREDLFYRLNVINFTVPALRERPEDIIPLSNDFLTHFCRVNHKGALRFTEEAQRVLMHYTWPGNVRELRNTVERAVILGGGQTICVNDFPENIIPTESLTTIGDPIPLAKIEELHIRRIMASASSLQEAADVLGIDQATLWRKRKTYSI